TLPTQETVGGTLGVLAEQLKSRDERRPAVLIVGRVVALREHLRWFDARPLFGKRVLVTRPRDQAADLVERFEELGADAIEAPMIRVVPPEDYGPLDAACARIGEFAWVVFASTNAVDAFMDRLLAGANDVRALHDVRLCAVGTGTAERLARYGLKVDLVPAEYRAESIVEALGHDAALRGARVLLPRADIGREVVADGLRALGADVTEVVAYRTVAADIEREGEPDIYRMLLERRIDVITFTSASAVRGL